MMRCRVFAGDDTDRFRIDTADSGHFFRWKLFDVFFELVEALGITFDVVFVREAFFDNDMHQGVEKGHVAATLELQHVRGVS